MSAYRPPHGPMPPWSMQDTMAGMHRQIAHANQQMNSALANAKVEISAANATMRSTFGPSIMPPPVPPPTFVTFSPGVLRIPAAVSSPFPPVISHTVPLYAGRCNPPQPSAKVRGPDLSRTPIRAGRAALSASRRHRLERPTPPLSQPPQSPSPFAPSADVWDQPSESRPSTPPPPAYDSWSFVDERFGPSQDSSPESPRSSSTFEPEARHRQTRRKRAAPSTEPALTFYRYGPPSTKAETNVDDETDVSPKSGWAVDASRSSVCRGEPSSACDNPDQDMFQPPVGGPKKMKRPAGWRPEWNCRRDLLSFVPSFIRRVSSSGGGNDMPDMRDRTLAAEIDWRFPGEDTNLNYDLRSPPMATALNFRSPATAPPAPWMRLYHRALPWYIDIESSKAVGITIRNVMKQVHKQLMIPLTERDVWNEGMNEEMRNSVAQGVRRRTIKGAGGKSVLGGSKPVRLDFLGNNYIFEGLAKGPNGMWEIKTRDWRA